MAQVAAVDVGSNSVLLLLADVTPRGIEILYEGGDVTRLGKGLGTTGSLDAESIRRTLAVLRGFRARVAESGAKIAAVGTEALRRARNGSDFLAQARQALGAEVEVIDPEREATLALRAVSYCFPDVSGPLVVVDVGGGSSEVTLGNEGRLEGFASLPLGSVRLHERHLRHDPPRPDEIEALRADVDRVIAACPFRPPTGVPAFGVAATVTTLAAVAQRVTPYEARRVHGSSLARAEVIRQATQYARLTVSARREIPGLSPRRADVILAGALVVERLMGWLGIESLHVSDRGLRWGLLLEAAGVG